MKILAVERLFGEPLNDFPETHLIADSAMVLQGRPLFLPLDPENYCIDLVPAVRIGRLGKSIPTKFAHRYRDAFTIAARVVLKDSSKMNSGNALATSFDMAFAPGLWIADAFNTESPMLNVSLNENDKFDLTTENLLVDETISLLSNYITLKNGDIIVPCRFDNIGFPAEVNSRILATANSETILDLKLK